MCLGRNLRVTEGARYGEAGRNGALGAVRRTLIHDRANSMSKQSLISNFDERTLAATDVVATSSWLRMWSSRDLRLRMW
jgi:hypothetical protein